MPAIRVTGNRRRTGGKNDVTFATGRIAVAGRVGSYPAGSLGLTHVNTLVVTPSSAVGQATRFGIVGSVRDPETTARNTILLRAIHLGTGTRTTSLLAFGSTRASGTVSGHFIATGY